MKTRWARTALAVALVVGVSFAANAADSIWGRVTAVKSPDVIVLNYGAGEYVIRIVGIDAPPTSARAARTEAQRVVTQTAAREERARAIRAARRRRDGGACLHGRSRRHQGSRRGARETRPGAAARRLRHQIRRHGRGRKRSTVGAARTLVDRPTEIRKRGRRVQSHYRCVPARGRLARRVAVDKRRRARAGAARAGHRRQHIAEDRRRHRMRDRQEPDESQSTLRVVQHGGRGPLRGTQHGWRRDMDLSGRRQDARRRRCGARAGGLL